MEHEQLELTDKQRDELDKRIADNNSSPDDEYSWAEVKSIIRRKSK